MNKTAHGIESDPVMMQAGEWLLEVEAGDAQPERLEAWRSWLAADEGHRHAFDALRRTWGQTGNLTDIHWPTDDEVRNDRHTSDIAVSEWRSRSSKQRAVQRVWAAAAMVVVTIGGAWIGVTALGGWSRTEILETRAGQNRTMRLSDGSTVAIGAVSRVSVSMLVDKRSLRLERGEAYFEVAKDPKRPFSVRAGDTTVTAIGTAFNVRLSGSRVVVAVAEGAVKVADAGHPGTRQKLTAGQRIVVAPDGDRTPTIELVAPQAVASWREGRLQFAGEPFSAVVADVNRYAVTRIVIGDEDLGDLRITGTVSQKNIDDWLKSLEKALPVTVTRDSGAITLSRRQ